MRYRRKDIPAISRNFVINNFEDLYGSFQEKWEEVFKSLQRFEFYGNIRELFNILKRLAILFQKREKYSVEDLISLAYDEKEKLAFSKEVKKKKNELERILEMLDSKDWDKNSVAKELGISRTTLWRKMKIYGIGE